MRYLMVLVWLAGGLFSLGAVSPQAAAAPDMGLNNDELHGPALSLQVIVETYGVDHEGVYPASLAELYAAASKGPSPYWLQEVKQNGQVPTWLQQKLPVVFADEALLKGKALEAVTLFQTVPGQQTSQQRGGYVLYRRVSERCYQITRYDAQGQQILLKQQPLIYMSADCP